MSIRFEQKRSDIVDAALSMFLAQGFNGTSMDQVAKEANVSKATLYNHFADKNALFREVMIWHCQSLSLKMSQTKSLAKGSLEDKLTHFAHALVKGLLSTRSIALMRVVIFECGQFPKLGNDIWHHGLPFLDEFASFLRAQHEEQTLQIPDVLLASRQFFGLIKENLVWPVLMGVESTPSTKFTNDVIKSAIAMFLNHYRAVPMKVM